MEKDGVLEEDSALCIYVHPKPSNVKYMDEMFGDVVENLILASDLDEDGLWSANGEPTHDTVSYGPFVKKGEPKLVTKDDVRKKFPALVRVIEEWVEKNQDVEFVLSHVGVFKKAIPYTPIVYFCECPAMDEFLFNARKACPQLHAEYKAMHEAEMESNKHYESFQSYKLAFIGFTHMTIGGIKLSWDDFEAYATKKDLYLRKVREGNDTQAESFLKHLERFFAGYGYHKGRSIPMDRVSVVLPGTGDQLDWSLVHVEEDEMGV